MRLIDADALLEQLEYLLKTREDDAKYSGCRGAVVTWNDAIYAIKIAPTIEPEPQWTPCNEKLPEDYEDVLVWFEYFRYGDYNRLYQTHGIGDYSSKYDSWMINHESGWRKLRVFAWMPLPDPYGGEKDG